MLTFQQIYEEAQAQVEDTNASSLILLKRAINQGMKKFGAILSRDWRTVSKTFSTVANQQFYQLPEDCIRPKSLIVTVGSVAYPLTEIADEEVWQDFTMRTQTSSVPQVYYVRGNDEFGIWPTPSGVNTGTLTYERRMRDMTEADYTTGTVTMANNSAAVVGSGTVWTANMVGRVLFVTDGSADGQGYKISSFTDTTHLTLENYYAGTAGSGKVYSIGEVPDIPDEFHESLVDYACYRYYRRRRDKALAADMLAAFKESLIECQADYSSKISSQYIRSPRVVTGYRHYNRDYTVT